jgi:hypothetical protein
MADLPADNPPTRALADVAQGFGQLASWYWGLVTDQARRTTGQGLVPAAARWSALPVVGLAALTAEVVDAASLVARPARARRDRLSDEFLAPAAWHERDLSLHEPLRNGFDEDLAAEGLAVTVTFGTSPANAAALGPKLPALAAPDADHIVIRLRATGIPADRVGVYRGRLGPSTDDTIPVWLVIP